MAPHPILFTHYGENWIRGSERCLLDLLGHLDRRRFDPFVWTNNTALVEAVRGLGITTYSSRFSILFHFDPPRLDFPNYFQLIREGREIVRRHRVRLLHSNSGAPNQWLVPISRREHVPLLLHLHAPYAQRERCTLRMHQATLVIGGSRGCVDGLVADGMAPERVRVIYYGVDATLLAQGDERDLRSRLGIAPDDVVLARVGSLIQRKGVDLMLRAFAELLRSHPRCHLLVVGEGPERSELERLSDSLGLSGRVHFLGLVPSAGAVLRDATDVAVSPARMEGFGLTVIEAGLFGLPIVATDTPGMREILTHEQDGLIVPIEDVSALVSALVRVVRDPELRDRLGAAVRETVERRFSIRRYIAELEQTYEELLGNPGWARERSGIRAALRPYWRWIRDAAARRLDPSPRTEPAPS